MLSGYGHRVQRSSAKASPVAPAGGTCDKGQGAQPNGGILPLTQQRYNKRSRARPARGQFKRRPHERVERDGSVRIVQVGRYLNYSSVIPELPSIPERRKEEERECTVMQPVAEAKDMPLWLQWYQPYNLYPELFERPRDSLWSRMGKILSFITTWECFVKIGHFIEHTKLSLSYLVKCFSLMATQLKMGG